MKQFKLQRGGSVFVRMDGVIFNVVLGYVLPNLPTRQLELTWRDTRELIAALQGVLAERDRLAAVQVPGLSAEEIERLVTEAEVGYPVTQITSTGRLPEPSISSEEKNEH